MEQVIFQALPEGMEETTINRWYHEEGDEIVEGDELVEIISEMGVLTINAPCSGILGEVYFSEGDSVSVGDVLCEIEEE